MSNQKENFLNVDEAAALLKIRKSTLYKKCHLKEVPHYKFGARTLFKESELLAKINQNKVLTNEEISAHAAGY